MFLIFHGKLHKTWLWWPEVRPIQPLSRHKLLSFNLAQTRSCSKETTTYDNNKKNKNRYPRSLRLQCKNRVPNLCSVWWSSHLSHRYAELFGIVISSPTTEGKKNLKPNQICLTPPSWCDRTWVTCGAQILDSSCEVPSHGIAISGYPTPRMAK